MEQHTKKEHYIPCCYIENWYNKNNKVWAYNTQYHKSREYTSKQICSIDDLYEGNFEINLIENDLSRKSEPLLSDVIRKIINHEKITELETHSLIYHALLLLLRSPLLINNLPEKLNIDKSTYLLGTIPLHENNIVMTKLLERIGVGKYCYCIELKHKFFVFNDVCPVLIKNPNIDGFKEEYDSDANLYFPISPNMCIIITNKYNGDNFYVSAVAKYVDYINELFINCKCKYIYSQNKIDEYIQKHLERKFEK